ncbi:hypothetical protein FRC20_002405 [Serendipita sp. 405]|nr:hypothetical protein FRC15_001570 [Serendipita sp. 397]KAG8788700.1 hypothetical protein FRC16_001326 [Serendipita sp. 398]KAG8822373.1 hypothetical protein FRC18_011029 [Serendipita sp. 400]KAG8848993.1 hypothetical protein FRC20_002405 [Serendipita sp. 405]
MENDDTRILNLKPRISEHGHGHGHGQDSPNLPQTIQTLLTPAPIQSFNDEFSNLITLGKHFGFIGSTIFTFLEEDRHAETLRTTLKAFNEHGDAMTSKMGDAFSSSRSFYVHNHGQFSGQDTPTQITDDHVQILFDPAFQRKVMGHAQAAATAWGDAAHILRTNMIPSLPLVQRELDTFVEDYDMRNRINEQRRQSWLPYFVQDSLWGSIEPVRWNVKEVEALPQDCVTGGKLLIRLLGFLGRMQAHFLRMSQLQFADFPEMGISTSYSLRGLYSSRLECAAMLRNMDLMNSTIEKAFWHGLP